MRRVAAAGLTVLLFGVTAPALAADPQQAEQLTDVTVIDIARIVEKDAASECTGGSIVDDGGFENGLRIAFVADARFVQRLTPTSYPALLDRICVCWVTTDGLQSMSYGLLVYDDNGSGGQPGTFLGGKQVAAVNLDGFVEELFGYECSDLGVTLESGSAYVGVSWNSAAEVDYFLCTDESFSTPQAVHYTSSTGGQIWTPVVNNFPETKAFGLRAHFTQVEPPEDPDPPATGAITSAQYPGFRFWVRISDSRIGTPVADCMPATVCVAGAIPTQAEILLRLTARPGGKLWPTIVKFNTTKTEVWVQQVSTGLIRYYSLEALPPSGTILPGLIDKVGFQQ